MWERDRRKNRFCCWHEKELASLGFFAIGKKGELKKSIQTATLRIQELKASKDTIKKKYEDRIAAIKAKADKESANAKPEIEQQFPIPDSPEEQERKRKIAEAEEARRKAELAAEKKQKDALDKILNVWKRDSKEGPGTDYYINKPNRPSSDIVNTVQIRLDLFDFYIHHEGQNILTANSYASSLVRNNELLALSCVDDLVYQKYFKQYVGSNGTTTCQLTAKGKKFLDDYKKFYGK